MEGGNLGGAMRLQLGQSNGRNSGLRNYRSDGGNSIAEPSRLGRSRKGKRYRCDLWLCGGRRSNEAALSCGAPYALPLGEPEEGEVQEYAMEFFNILCGRFISELYKATETTTRFFPTRYEALPNPTGLGGDTSLSTVYFISDEEELAAFSWTAEVVNDLLRRSMHGQV